ncbi:MAG: hypothetical protein GY711_13725 [bacterium]|nr:hypothetical protein [bacterium]
MSTLAGSPPRRFTLHALARAALGLLAACALGCASRGPAVVPVAAEASAAFERAWHELRATRTGDGVPGARERALAAAQEAARFAPGWVAPRRFLDDFAREDLRLPEAVESYRARLTAAPESPDLEYLIGRLEGEAGGRRFHRAAALDPDHAWARHGVGWRAFTSGSVNRALNHGKRALQLARDPFERSNFSSVLARYHLRAQQPKRAAEALEERLRQPDAAPHAAWLGTELAVIEMGAEDEVLVQRGARRALELFARDDLTNGELRDLVIAAVSLPVTTGLSREDLRLALMSTDDPVRRRLFGEWLARDRSRMALETSGALERANTVEARARRLALDDPARVIEDWRAGLPRRVLTAEGLPRDPRLAALVTAARAGDRRAIGDALIGAGWFQEARAFASSVPDGDLDAAIDLERRALAGSNLVRNLVALALALEQRSARFEPELDAAPGDPGHTGRRVESLEELLEAFAPVLARVRAHLGGEMHEEAVAAELAATPEVGYGLIGGILHPGPHFSAQDERLGRGRDGDPVPGLSAVLRSVGRFGLFGWFLGGGPPDGTLLRVLLVEQHAGEHLGAPWRGTVALCEGADLEGRASRAGASIAGAALHEGYWIDISVLRIELARWRALAADFEGDDALERVRAALAQTGLSFQHKGDRAAIDTPLREADRVRLAIMHDRARAGEGTAALSVIEIDDLLDATAMHEQGHLCDRARWYPFSENVGALFGLLFREGFSARRLARRLEYRAQLVALCDAAEPRIPLVDLLEAAEAEGPGITPHGAAYAELLEDLLEDLDGALESEPEAWPELDPGRTLVHQLHRLAPERVRVLARAQAEEVGLVE